MCILLENKVRSLAESTDEICLECDHIVVPYKLLIHAISKFNETIFVEKEVLNQFLEGASMKGYLCQ